MFISVDIVNSTKYKNILSKSSEDVQPWLEFFSHFYKYFPQDLNDEIHKLSNKDEFTSVHGDKLKVWKLLGDEIVFYTELKDYRETHLYIIALKQTMKSFSKQYINEKYLALKSSAWIAGFPVGNTEFKVEDKTDFLGPSIDIGFRLSKFATTEKIVISVDLALLLLEKNIDGLKYFFDGYHVLKGVFLDREYPIISVDNRIDVKYNVMCHSDTNELKKLCKEYIGEEYNPLIRPFIEEDIGNEFKQKPKDYEKDLEKIDRLYKKISLKFLKDIVNNHTQIKNIIEDKELEYSTGTVNIEGNLEALIVIDGEEFRFDIPIPNLMAEKSRDSNEYNDEQIEIDGKIIEVSIISGMYGIDISLAGDTDSFEHILIDVVENIDAKLT